MSDRYWTSPYGQRSFQTSGSHHSSGQYPSIYPRELRLDDSGDGTPFANDRSTRSRRQHRDRFSQLRDYVPARRDWEPPVRASRDSARGQSPMSRWNRESSRDSPWNGIAGVYPGSGGGYGYGYGYGRSTRSDHGGLSAYTAWAGSHR